MDLITLVVTLFLIMDSFGNVSSFLKMVDGIPPKRQRMIVFREMGIALIFMVIFNYIGEWIFTYLGISETAVQLSAGMILFLTALKVLFPSADSIRSNIPAGEPFIVPLAIPLISGPSLLATIMIFAHVENSQPVMLAAIVIAWAMSIAVLLSSSLLKRALGTNGLTALERLLALVLIMLAIQRFMDGINLFVATYA